MAEKLGPLQKIVTTCSLNAVSFTDANNGIAVGHYSGLGLVGIILRTTNGGVVPVELSSFTATTNGKEVTLSWSTATELNNQGDLKYKENLAVIILKQLAQLKDTAQQFLKINILT